MKDKEEYSALFVRVYKDQWEDLHKLSFMEGKSKSELVREAIIELFKGRGEDKKNV